MCDTSIACMYRLVRGCQVICGGASHSSAAAEAADLYGRHALHTGRLNAVVPVNAGRECRLRLNVSSTREV